MTTGQARGKAAREITRKPEESHNAGQLAEPATCDLTRLVTYCQQNVDNHAIGR